MTLGNKHKIIFKRNSNRPHLFGVFVREPLPGAGGGADGDEDEDEAPSDGGRPTMTDHFRQPTFKRLTGRKSSTSIKFKSLPTVRVRL